MRQDIIGDDDLARLCLDLAQAVNTLSNSTLDRKLHETNYPDIERSTSNLTLPNYLQDKFKLCLKKNLSPEIRKEIESAARSNRVQGLLDSINMAEGAITNETDFNRLRAAHIETFKKFSAARKSLAEHIKKLKNPGGQDTKLLAGSEYIGGCETNRDFLSGLLQLDKLAIQVRIEAEKLATKVTEFESQLPHQRQNTNPYQHQKGELKTLIESAGHISSHVGQILGEMSDDNRAILIDEVAHNTTQGSCGRQYNVSSLIHATLGATEVMCQDGWTSFKADHFAIPGRPELLKKIFESAEQIPAHLRRVILSDDDFAQTCVNHLSCVARAEEDARIHQMENDYSAFMDNLPSRHQEIKRHAETLSELQQVGNLTLSLKVAKNVEHWRRAVLCLMIGEFGCTVESSCRKLGLTTLNGGIAFEHIKCPEDKMQDTLKYLASCVKLFRRVRYIVAKEPDQILSGNSFSGNTYRWVHHPEQQHTELLQDIRQIKSLCGAVLSNLRHLDLDRPSWPEETKETIQAGAAAIQLANGCCEDVERELTRQ